MKKIIQSLLCTSLFVFASFTSIADETVVNLYNYETEAFEEIDVMTVTADNALKYLPESQTVLALFQAYLSKGEPANLALMSTLSDVSKAKSSVEGDGNMLEVYNFKLMKNETVDVSTLTQETAKDYIPQSESLFKLFDFYLEEHGVEQSLYRTLIDANSILEKEGAK